LLFTTQQMCAITGVPEGTIKRLRASGSILAARRGSRGRGHPDRWSASQVLALAVARGLRGCGVPAANAESVLQYFWQMSDASLDRHFRAGRTCLMLVAGPDGTGCLPVLVHRESILKNDDIDANAVTALRLGVRPSALDVAAIWDFIQKCSAKAGNAGENPCNARKRKKPSRSDSSPTA
jgi:hypothetical protein